MPLKIRIKWSVFQCPSASIFTLYNPTFCVMFYYMYNKFKEGLIGNNAYLNWKAYMKKVASAYAYRRVDNTMDDTTETNLANKYAKALVKDLDKHRQLD